MTGGFPGSGANPLPTYNPWPEDPGFYDAMVSRLTAREDKTNQIRSGVQGLINDPALGQWLGASADAFKTTLEPLPALLAQMVEAYGAAADTVKTFVGRVRAGQDAWTKLQNGMQARAVADPSLVDDPFFGLKKQLDMFAQDAISAHDTAVKTASKVVWDAVGNLQRVYDALGDKRYADFNTTFIKAGGNISDLTGLEYAGGDLQPTTVDPEKLIQSIAWMNQHLGDNGDGWLAGISAMEYYNQVKNMTPPEIDALLAMMSPTERQNLNGTIAKLDDAARSNWTNLVLANASQSTLDVVKQDMPNVELDRQSQGSKDGLYWETRGQPLFGPAG